MSKFLWEGAGFSVLRLGKGKYVKTFRERHLSFVKRFRTSVLCQTKSKFEFIRRVNAPTTKTKLDYTSHHLIFKPGARISTRRRPVDYRSKKTTETLCHLIFWHQKSRRDSIPKSFILHLSRAFVGELTTMGEPIILGDVK